MRCVCLILCFRCIALMRYWTYINVFWGWKVLQCFLGLCCSVNCCWRLIRCVFYILAPSTIIVIIIRFIITITNSCVFSADFVGSLRHFRHRIVVASYRPLPMTISDISCCACSSSLVCRCQRHRDWQAGTQRQQGNTLYHIWMMRFWLGRQFRVAFLYSRESVLTSFHDSEDLGINGRMVVFGIHGSQAWEVDGTIRNCSMYRIHVANCLGRHYICDGVWICSTCVHWSVNQRTAFLLVCMDGKSRCHG